jgi:hypothetical protein
MLTTGQDIVIVILIVTCSQIFMLLVNRCWPASQRVAHNDIIGWQLGILGTTYAVIMGFMLYTVWTDFGAAELNADSESNALLNIYRLADGLPEQQRNELKQAARAYADVVVQQDWPSMLAGENVPLKSREAATKMWQILMSIKSASGVELTAEDHALYELSTLAEHRQMRRLQSVSRLPRVLWFVLIVGGVVTIASSCMFGSANTTLHGVQVFAFSLLIALVLIAIGDIDRPFQGTVHVKETPFTRAQSIMQEP